MNLQTTQLEDSTFRSPKTFLQALYYTVCSWYYNKKLIIYAILSFPHTMLFMYIVLAFKFHSLKQSWHSADIPGLPNASPSSFHGFLLNIHPWVIYLRITLMRFMGICDWFATHFVVPLLCIHLRNKDEDIHSQISSCLPNTIIREKFP